MVGTQVNPNVRLLRPLGQGAMGTVWVAEHLTLRTEVAVKFISAELAAEQPEIATRFEREAAAAAQIKSPHVIQTFDRGSTEDGTPYIVMELLDGRTLGQTLAEDGPLSLSETAQVIVQVSRALRRAHDVGIIHRDIKPDNIFVSTTDEGPFCKVLDFGIAKQAHLPQLAGLTNPGMLVGTPEYMNPEQFLNAGDPDFYADLWALAVTAYQCLTCESPFPGQTLGTLCAQLLKGEFALPSVYREDLPSAVDRWFARALARDQTERFSSAREFGLAFAASAATGETGFEDTVMSSAGGSAVSASQLVSRPMPPPSSGAGSAPSNVQSQRTSLGMPRASMPLSKVSASDAMVSSSGPSESAPAVSASSTQRSDVSSALSDSSTATSGVSTLTREVSVASGSHSSTSRSWLGVAGVLLLVAGGWFAFGSKPKAAMTATSPDSQPSAELPRAGAAQVASPEPQPSVEMPLTVPSALALPVAPIDSASVLRGLPRPAGSGIEKPRPKSTKVDYGF